MLSLQFRVECPPGFDFRAYDPDSLYTERGPDSRRHGDLPDGLVDSTPDRQRGPGYMGPDSGFALEPSFMSAASADHAHTGSYVCVMRGDSFPDWATTSDFFDEMPFYVNVLPDLN